MTIAPIFHLRISQLLRTVYLNQLRVDEVDFDTNLYHPRPYCYLLPSIVCMGAVIGLAKAVPGEKEITGEEKGIIEGIIEGMV